MSVKNTTGRVVSRPACIAVRDVICVVGQNESHLTTNYS